MSKIDMVKKSDGFKTFIKKYGYLFVAGLVAVAIVLTVLLTTGKASPAPITVPDETPVATKALEFDLPLANCTTAKSFSDSALQWNNTLELFELHTAVDLVSESSSAVLAAEAGKISKIDKTYGNGTCIEITHNNGYKTIYSSLAEEVLVNEGDSVEKGTQIGSVSATASNELNMGNHLHFEMIKDGTKVNPADYLNLESK